MYDAMRRERAALFEFESAAPQRAERLVDELGGDEFTGKGAAECIRPGTCWSMSWASKG
jgi:hypothetical protein